MPQPNFQPCCIPAARSYPNSWVSALCLAYLLFLLIYFREYELKSRTEQYNELINMQLRSLRSEIEQAKKSEHNMSILRHDMRHHLMILQTYVQNQETDKALDYIQQIHQTYENTIISTFSQNELLNSILSIYSSRLQELGIAFHAPGRRTQRSSLFRDDLLCNPV